MPYAFIDTQDTDGVLVITKDDPTTRNAIGDEMAGEINQDIARRTDDHKEGVRAFIEKRQPKYLGR